MFELGGHLHAFSLYAGVFFQNLADTAIHLADTAIHLADTAIHTAIHHADTAFHL